MKTLLDTHTLIWFLEGDHSISKKARAAIESNPESNYVSIASIWEIAIKISLNKLELKKPLQDLYILLQQNGFHLLPISFDDTLTVASLPFHHRDPFDRIMIAQAINNRLSIISRDEYFKLYETPVIW